MNLSVVFIAAQCLKILHMKMKAMTISEILIVTLVFSQTFTHSFRTSEVYCLGSIFLFNPYLNEYIVATFITLHYFDDFKRK